MQLPTHESSYQASSLIDFWEKHTLPTRAPAHGCYYRSPVLVLQKTGELPAHAFGHGYYWWRRPLGEGMRRKNQLVGAWST